MSEKSFLPVLALCKFVFADCFAIIIPLPNHHFLLRETWIYPPVFVTVEDDDTKRPVPIVNPV